GDRIRVPLEAVPQGAGVQVPDQDSAIGAPGGEGPAIGTECEAVDVSVVRIRPGFPAGGPLPSPPIPDRAASIQASRSEIPAVGAVRHADDRFLRRQSARLFIAPPLEVVPFPTAQMGRALVEQLLSPPEVVSC